MDHLILNNGSDGAALAEVALKALREARNSKTSNSGSIFVSDRQTDDNGIALGTGTIINGVDGGIQTWVGDTTPPGKPTGLSVSSKNAAVSVSWDGSMEGGKPLDWGHLQLLATDDKGNNYDFGVLYGSGSQQLADLTPGAKLTVWAVGYDDAHDAHGKSAPNASTPSDSLTVTVESAVDPKDIEKVQSDAQTALNQLAGELQSNLGNQISHAINGSTNYYAQTSDPSNPPSTGWSTTAPTWVDGMYIWVKTTVTKGDGSHETTAPIVVTGNTGAQGKPGADGADGAPGKDGIGVTNTTVTYQSGTSGTTAPTGTWSASVPIVTPGNWLWTRTVWKYTDGTNETAYSTAHIGKDGNTGNDGAPGKDGVGIESSVISYASSASGTSAPSSGWQAMPPNAAAGMYVWTRTVFTYTDNTSETAYSVGMIGAKGDKGDTGHPGAQGVSVTSVTRWYALGSSTPAKPIVQKPSSPWTTTEPAYTVGVNLYYADVVAYSNGQFSWSNVQLSSSYKSATTAINTANSKSTIFVQSATPTASTDNDFWFQLNGSGNVIHLWKSTAAGSGSWAKYVVVADQIFVPSSVGTISLSNGAVTADKVTASEALLTKLLVRELNADDIDVGSLAAAIVTSGLFRTAASGARVVVDSTGIKAYDTNGNVTFQVDSATGKATMVGGMATGVSGQNRAVVGYNNKTQQGEFTIIGSDDAPIFSINGGQASKTRYAYLMVANPQGLTPDIRISNTGAVSGETSIEFNADEVCLNYHDLTSKGRCVFNWESSWSGTSGSGTGYLEKKSNFSMSRGWYLIEAYVRTNGVGKEYHLDMLAKRTDGTLMDTWAMNLPMPSRGIGNMSCSQMVYVEDNSVDLAAQLYSRDYGSNPRMFADNDSKWSLYYPKHALSRYFRIFAM
jgi:hypothetical protein